MINPFLIGLAAKKFWPPARARRKGGVWGEFRRARASRRSEAEAVSSVQKMFEQSWKELNMARQTEFCLGTPIDWRAILLTVDKSFTSLIAGVLRRWNSLNSGLSQRRKENLCWISLLGKANTMWILFPKTLKEDCAKKSAEANTRVLRPLAI